MRAAVRAEVGVERVRCGLRARLILCLLAHPAIHYSMDRSQPSADYEVHILRASYAFVALLEQVRQPRAAFVLLALQPHATHQHKRPTFARFALVRVSPNCCEIERRVTCFLSTLTLYTNTLLTGLNTTAEYL